MAPVQYQNVMTACSYIIPFTILSLNVRTIYFAFAVGIALPRQSFVYTDLKWPQQQPQIEKKKKTDGHGSR